MSYKDDRYNLILQLEQSGNPAESPYADSDGYITIGVGFNINYKKNKTVADLVLSKLGLDDNFNTSEAEATNDIYRIQIENYLKNTTKTTAQIQNDLNAIMANRAADEALKSYNLPTKFEFQSEQDIKDVFNSAAFIDTYERKVTDFLKDIQGTGSLKIENNSDEHLALLSLSYNQDNSNPLLGNGLAWAIKNGNRAEAWFQIRYVSNLDKVQAKRRYAESEVFGLYANPTNPTDEELKDFYRTYRLHQAKIDKYEKDYGQYISDANANLLNISYGDQVETLAQEKEYALDLLEERFGEDIDIDNVIVGIDTVNDNSTNKGKENINDNLQGTNKNDLIFGERGDDTLVGNGGSDVLVGGEGDDKYIINNGLYDTIIDSDNKGKIEFSNSFGTINLTGGVGENGIYKSDLFAMEYKIVENDLHISSFGNLVAIYKNFDKNNNLKSRTENDGKIIDVGLGMKLEDSGTKNTTIGNGPTYVAVQTLQEWRTYQIAYQVAKKDKDGNTYYVTRYKDNPLYNVRYDGDNVINANNSSNMIKAKYGADIINAGGGHDNIHTIDGNDTINGGSGWDKIQAAGDNNVIDGGSGSDTIITKNYSKIQTGTGKDTVTAGSYANVTNESGNDRVNLGNNSSFTGSEWSENITVGINSTVLAGEGNNTINHGGGGNIDVSNGHNYIKTLDKSIISVVDGNNRLFASDENTITIGNGKNQIIIKNNNKVTIGDGDNDVKVESNNNIVAGTGKNKINVLNSNQINIENNNSNITAMDKNTIKVKNSQGRMIVNDDNTINIETGKNSITLGNNNVVHSKTSSNTIHGNDSNKIYISSGDNSITLNEKNHIETGKGDDSFNVVNSNKIISANGNNNVFLDSNNQVNLGLGKDTVTLDKTDSKNNINTGRGADTIVLAANSYNSRIENNTINADEGDDYINIQNIIKSTNAINMEVVGNTINAGAGDDTVNITNKNSNFYFKNNSINTGIGSDKLNFTNEAREDANFIVNIIANTINTGAGDDNINVSNIYNRYTRKISTYFNNNNINLGSGNDNIYVDAKTIENNNINTAEGDDIVRFTQGSYNNITTGDGNDIVEFKSIKNKHLYNNTIITGAGDDKIDYEGGDTSFSSHLKRSEGLNIDTGNGHDEINLALVDKGTIKTGTGDDKIKSSKASDFIIDMGDGDNDLLFHNGGNNNHITTGRGNDKIQIDFGKNNTVITGDGDDVITMAGYYNGTIENTENNSIDSGSGNDSIYLARAHKQLVNTGSGEDFINLASGYNTINTGKDDDVIHTTDIHGVIKNQISLGEGDDKILSLIRNDNLYPWEETSFIGDTILGKNGNDIIETGLGDDTILGGEGDDILDAFYGNNTLDGDKGNDTYIIASEDDIYIKVDNSPRMMTMPSEEPEIFEFKKSNDVISDIQGIDNLVFKNDISREDLLFSRDGEDILIHYGIRMQHSIRVKNNSIETYTMTDGSFLSKEQIIDLMNKMGDNNINDIFNSQKLKNLQYHTWNKKYKTYDNPYHEFNNDNEIISGDDNNNYISSIGGDDTLIGKKGDDILEGGNGDDIYVYRLGDGNDIISEQVESLKLNGDVDVMPTMMDMKASDEGNDSEEGIKLRRNITSNNDTLVLEGISKEQLSVRVTGQENNRSDLELIITNGEVSEKILLVNFFDERATIEKIYLKDSDEELMSQDILKLQHLPNKWETTLIRGFDWQDNELHAQSNEENMIIGGAQDDIIYGGEGYDELFGGTGNDTYHFKVNNGEDFIYDNFRVSNMYTEDIGLDFGYKNVGELNGYGNGVEYNDDGVSKYFKGKAEGGIDTIVFEKGISKKDLKIEIIDRSEMIEMDPFAISMNNNDIPDVVNTSIDLKISIKDNPESQVTIIDCYGEGKIEYFKFADGSIYALEELFNEIPMLNSDTINLTLQDIRSTAGEVEASDIDGDTLSYTLKTEPTNGNLTLNSDGTWSYEANGTYKGSDSAIVEISDGNGGVVEQTLNFDMKVTPPTLDNVTNTLDEDTNITDTLHVINPVGGTLTYEVIDSSDNGSFTLNQDGTYSYNPLANYNGNDAVTIKVTNEYGLSTTASIDLTIAPVNDAPTIENESESYLLKNSRIVTSQLHAEDIDNDTLSYNVSTQAQHGTVSVDENGVWIYKAQGSFNGDDSAIITVDDGNGGVVEQILNFSVEGYIYEGEDLVIDEINGEDTLAMETVNKDDLSFGRNEDDLVISVSQDSTITLKNYFSNTQAGVQTLHLAQGDISLTRDVINEVMYGGYKALDSKDHLISGDLSHNWLIGNDGNDILLGSGGNDYISGGNNNDLIVGGNGNDNLHGNSGDDTIYADDGNDSIYAGDGNDTLIGGNGKDTLFGGRGDDWISGGSDNDTIYSNQGDDTVDGGAGDDYINSSQGNDTYLFNLGDGNDTVVDTSAYGSSEVDKIIFGAGITNDNLQVIRDGYDLILKINENDSMQVKYWFASAQRNTIEQIEFSDGTLLQTEDINALATIVGDERNNVLGGFYGFDDHIYGFGGNDSLYGYGGDDFLSGGEGRDKLYGGAGDDTLQGGTGNDRLKGSYGSDTYTFNKGDGNDTIVDSAQWGSSDSDVIKFAEGVNKEDISFAMKNGNLHIQYSQDDTVDVLYAQYNSRFQIEKIELSNGNYLESTDMDRIIQEMSSYAVDNGIDISSQDNIRNNKALMQIVSSGWQSA